MKEFLGNVLIQPFHCIMYMIFIQNVMYSVFSVTGIFDFGKVFIAIVMLPIVYKAEDIVKQIFGLETKNLQSALAMGALMLSQAKKGAQMAKKAAGASKKALDGIQKPDKVQPAGNPSTSSEVAQNNMQQAEQQTATESGEGNGKDAKDRRFLKGIGKIATGKGEISRKLASKALGMAIGYGLTGELTGAIGTKDMPANVAKSATDIWSNVKSFNKAESMKEGMLDAYEDVKGYMQASNPNDNVDDLYMYDLANELIDKDISDITDDMQRQYAEWLHAMQDTYAALSGKDSEKEALEDGKAHVMELLQKHILK